MKDKVRDIFWGARKSATANGATIGGDDDMDEDDVGGGIGGSCAGVLCKRVYSRSRVTTSGTKKRSMSNASSAGMLENSGQPSTNAISSIWATRQALPQDGVNTATNCSRLRLPTPVANTATRPWRCLAWYSPMSMAALPGCVRSLRT